MGKDVITFDDIVIEKNKTSTTRKALFRYII